MQESGERSTKDAMAGDPIEPLNHRQKHPHVGKNQSQLVLPSGLIFEASDPASKALIVPASTSGSRPIVPPWPIWAKSAPLIPADPSNPIRHDANLSTPDRPAVPPELRGPRTPAELLKLVLSREGYFCAARTWPSLDIISFSASTEGPRPSSSS